MADFSSSFPSGLSAPGYEAVRSTTPDAAFCDRMDAHLIEMLRAGSEEAYEILIQRFQHPVFNLVTRLLDNPGEAADVLQEVFLKVFRKIDSFRGRSSLKTWIYRIAVNEAYNHRRFSSRHRKHEVSLGGAEDDGQSYQDVVPDQCISPFQAVADRETRLQIERALAAINPSFRSAVVLRDLEELSYEEIAQVLEISLGTVKSRILRGREALRKVLEKQQLMPHVRNNQEATVWRPFPAIEQS